LVQARQLTQVRRTCNSGPVYRNKCITLQRRAGAAPLPLSVVIRPPHARWLRCRRCKRRITFTPRKAPTSSREVPMHRKAPDLPRMAVPPFFWTLGSCRRLVGVVKSKVQSAHPSSHCGELHLHPRFIFQDRPYLLALIIDRMGTTAMLVNQRDHWTQTHRPANQTRTVAYTRCSPS
jgi:hypothetical protein